MEKKYEKDIDLLMEAIGDKASRDEIEKEFMKFVENFKISEKEAKKAIAKKYDIPLEDMGRTISELEPGENNVNILARITFVTEKEINAKGEEKQILSGFLADNTGSCAFTIWEKGDLSLEKGDVIRIESAYTTEYRDEVQINVGNRGVINKESRDALPPGSGGNGGGGPAKETRDVKISDIATKMDFDVNLSARIVFVNEKEITAQGEQKVIISGILGDETGTIPFTIWEKGDLSLEKGDVIKIEAAYITEWREQPQINIGNRGTVEMGDKDDMPEVKGGNGGGGQPKEVKDVKVSDIVTKPDFDVNITGKIVFVNEREITAKGEQKTIISGILGDETGTIPFTIWEKGDLSLEKGDVIKIGGAYITEWKEEPQINIGDRGTVEMGDGADVPEVKRGPSGPGRDVDISGIKDGDRNINVQVRILTREEKEIMIKEEMKTLISGTLADETGKIGYTCWGKAKFKVGDVVQISNGYIRSFRNMPQINFDQDNIDKSKAKLPTTKQLSKPVSSNIQGLVNSGGMLDAQVDGMVLDVRDGSGLIFRCPECNRAIKKNICKIHEKVEGIPDMRVKAVMDDGTGAMTAVIGKELSEKLINKSLDDCLGEAKDAMDYSIIQDQFSELMVARPMRAIGNVSLDDFGLFMIVNEIEFLKLDVENEARALMEVLS